MDANAVAHFTEQLNRAISNVEAGQIIYIQHAHGSGMYTALVEALAYRFELDEIVVINPRLATAGLSNFSDIFTKLSSAKALIINGHRPQLQLSKIPALSKEIAVLAAGEVVRSTNANGNVAYVQLPEDTLVIVCDVDRFYPQPRVSVDSLAID